MGLPGPRGPPGPPGEGAFQTGKGVAIVGPTGDKGEHGEKVGVDHDDNFSISSELCAFFFSQIFTARRPEVVVDAMTFLSACLFLLHTCISVVSLCPCKFQCNLIPSNISDLFRT